MKLLFDYGDLHNPATISMDTSGRLITESGNPLAGVKASFQRIVMAKESFWPEHLILIMIMKLYLMNSRIK
jgi:hypothetical protein